MLFFLNEEKTSDENCLRLYGPTAPQECVSNMSAACPPSVHADGKTNALNVSRSEVKGVKTDRNLLRFYELSVAATFFYTSFVCFFNVFNEFLIR